MMDERRYLGRLWNENSLHRKVQKKLQGTSRWDKNRNMFLLASFQQTYVVIYVLVNHYCIIHRFGACDVMGCLLFVLVLLFVCACSRRDSVTCLRRRSVVNMPFTPCCCSLVWLCVCWSPTCFGFSKHTAPAPSARSIPKLIATPIYCLPIHHIFSIAGNSR